MKLVRRLEKRFKKGVSGKPFQENRFKKTFQRSRFKQYRTTAVASQSFELTRKVHVIALLRTDLLKRFS